MKIRLSIRDQAFAHSPVSNGPTPAIVDGPELVEWDRTAPVSEKTIYTDAEIVNAPDGATIWLIEPLQSWRMEWLALNAPRFRTIWTHERRLLEMASNARFVPLAGTWMAPDDRYVFAKRKDVSTIASNKVGGAGYDLRHRIIKQLRSEVDAYGPDYFPLPRKIEALRDYRFQIVIENARQDFWFTEKLIDCFLTGTVPIYWGCPSIKTFFNTAGMLIAEDLASLLVQFDYATAENYQAMMPAIEDNFRRAARFTCAEDWIVKTNPALLAGLAL